MMWWCRFGISKAVYLRKIDTRYAILGQIEVSDERVGSCLLMITNAPNVAIVLKHGTASTRTRHPAQNVITPMSDD